MQVDINNYCIGECTCTAPVATIKSIFARARVAFHKKLNNYFMYWQRMKSRLNGSEF